MTVTAAARIYLSNNDATATYAKKTDLDNYATTASLNDYVTTTNADNTYATKNSLNTYLTATTAADTYLSKADAATTYAAKEDLVNYASRQFVTYGLKSYVTKTDAESTYAKKTDLDSYVTKDNAVTKDGDNTFTGTVTVSQTSGLNLANHILESNGNNLVIKSKNNTPILTLYPSVGYLNGREILNQFKADQLYIKKTDSGNYVAKSQYDSDMTALLTELRKLNGTN